MENLNKNWTETEITAETEIKLELENNFKSEIETEKKSYNLNNTDYIFALWSPSFFRFSSPNLSGRRLDVYRTWTHGVNLECRSEMYCTWLAGNAGPRKSSATCHLRTIAQFCWGWLRFNGTFNTE